MIFISITLSNEINFWNSFIIIKNGGLYGDTPTVKLFKLWFYHRSKNHFRVNSKTNKNHELQSNQIYKCQLLKTSVCTFLS